MHDDEAGEPTGTFSPANIRNGDETPARKFDLSARDKKQHVQRILAAMLYPPKKGNLSKLEYYANRILAVSAARKLARLERKAEENDLSEQDEKRWQRLERDFKAAGGFSALVNAPSGRFLNKKKLERAWEGWCSVYAILDTIHRASAMGRHPDGVRVVQFSLCDPVPHRVERV
jgi:hypothetical protein